MMFGVVEVFWLFFFSFSNYIFSGGFRFCLFFFIMRVCIFEYYRVVWCVFVFFKYGFYVVCVRSRLFKSSFVFIFGFRVSLFVMVVISYVWLFKVRLIKTK